MDYKAIKNEYETTKISFNKLSEKYNIHSKKISRLAKKEGWIKFKPTTKPTPPNKPTNPHKVTTTKESIIELLSDNYHKADIPLLEAYLDSYSTFKELQQDLKIEGRFLVSPKTKATYLNPKYTALQMEKNNIKALGKELGLSPILRIKKLITKDEDDGEPDIFDFIKNILGEDENSSSLV